MAMDPWRFITLYIGFSLISIFFGIMGYRVLKRDRKDRINQLLSSFYFLETSGLIVNLIYGSVTDPSLQALVNYMHILAVFFMNYAFAMLILFTILLYKPRIMSKSKNQLLFLLLYGGLLSVLFVIPDGAYVQILSDGTQLSPVWNLPFMIYAAIIMILSGIHTMYTSNKIYRQFNNKELAKKYKYFILGVFIFFLIYLEAMIFNYLNIPILRQIYPFTLIFLIFGAYGIYYGIGVKLKTPIDIRVSIEEEPVFKVKELT
jgi:hypothetical protein